MNILFEYPPNIEEIKKAFKPTIYTVYTYGENLYNPGKWPLPLDLIIHEKTHVIQQGKDPKAWWDRYIKDTQFRLHQELEAYRRQWKAILRGNSKDKIGLLRTIAEDLSGQMYGNIITYEEALKLIQQNGKVQYL